MDWGHLALGLIAGLLIATITAPVGVSGAVFLLPVQMDLLKVPNPAVTPTNLLYNVVSGPGALLRYRTQGQRPGELTRYMLAGTVPGVIAGAFVRIYLIPDARPFRLVAAAVLLPLGVWLIWRTLRPSARPRTADPSVRLIVGLGLVVGVLGGVYGIGGGSILAPILVARGLPLAKVAPAALASTFVTSIVGAAAFGLIALRTHGSVAPDWGLGIACGLGGLIGGYLGARWHRRLPERVLALMLGATAAALAVAYVYQSLR
ncbi:sulfite exporter TauE/SafE family protein [Nocardioides sp. TRM66260-LWL]|uniref:sulfite exporter TauE/SafE family protein n=1 Tax=Nocardioides sp. TRM66260-LWL TaxID=2874478 RepID=UPI001CC74E12|nr:sulfite exporter TauE/SafE family protein [Nocardioides sp. TRM66260-LWL]MBZ5735353.1 sulfite exporter TauE/SafE family protein [Nocardioides sp. TRM66260-LWL]